MDLFNIADDEAEIENIGPDDDLIDEDEPSTAIYQTRTTTTQVATTRSTNANRQVSDLRWLSEDVEIERSRVLQQAELTELIEPSYPARFWGSALSSSSSTRPERDILRDFVTQEEDDDFKSVEQDASSAANTFLEFDLESFCVYQDPSEGSKRHGLEARFESLHIVATTIDDVTWRIDGVLKTSCTCERFIRGKICDIAIGNLEDLNTHTAARSIWVQTVESRKWKYWYRLQSAAPGYTIYWNDFLWLADFTKFFLDYLHVVSEAGRSVVVADFKFRFWEWLQALHGPRIEQWHVRCGRKTDFLQDALSHILFLGAQAYTLDPGQDNPRFLHSIWKEAGAALQSYDMKTATKSERTVVTKAVAAAFRKVYPHWQTELSLLEVVDPCPETLAHQKKQRREHAYPDKLAYAQSDHFLCSGRRKISKTASLLENAPARRCSYININPITLIHKVVIVRNSNPNAQSDQPRFAWVRTSIGSRIEIVWLALPTDTLCGSAAEGSRYLIGNELFFTDECNCEKVDVHDVVSVIEASVFTDHAEEGKELFAHGLFRTREQIHVRATEHDLICYCMQPWARPLVVLNLTPPPAVHVPKMKVCALCCGCGKLSRVSLTGARLICFTGLLDHAFTASGFAETVLAVDVDERAVCSHRANNSAASCQYIIDSVNRVLKDHLTGKKSITQQIDCIVVGHPCQGFTRLNASRGNERGERNCSILANILSWIEALLPPFVLIENVPDMDRCRPSACAQAICVLVALGYSVRKSVKVAAAIGGASTRKRLFIVACAPGATLPDEMQDSNSDYEDGLQDMRSAGDTISHLEPITNETAINPKDPLHIPAQHLKMDWQAEISMRSVVRKIKTSLFDANSKGRLSKAECKWYRGLTEEQRSRGSHSVARFDPDRPFPTLTTRFVLKDARGAGRALHPTQHRFVSVREATLIMDAPTRFYFAGTPTEVIHQLGNGVP
jgi:site-specific DNA-cytosine methylase